MCLYKTVFSAQDQHFCQFRTECTTFQRLSAKCKSLYKTECLARGQHVFSLPHWAHSFLAIFSKVQELWCKTAFLARDQDVLSFLHWAHYFLAIFSKVQEFVQNTVFIARTARFVIFAPGAPLFSDFQQSTRVCTKQPFQPKISTFRHFRTGCTNF